MSRTSNGARQVFQRVSRHAVSGKDNTLIHKSRTVNGDSPNFSYSFNNPQRQFAPCRALMASDAIHPLKPLLRLKWSERDRSALLHWVRPPMTLDSHAVVRRYHARRVKHALYDVLRMKGMNRHGKPLDDKGEVQEKLDSPIKGSLEITLKKHAATSTDIELRQDLQKIVEKILLQLGGSRNP